MDRTAQVALIKDANGISEGRALAAFTTLLNIRTYGFEKVKGFMSRSTFYLHLRYLRNAGITDFDLYNGNVFPIRPVRVVLAQPVASWEDIKDITRSEKS
ncbi:MAG: hypothetical protein LBF93_00745 [Zoogloeaceae bacterium]|jgi:DNA-binding transcriptional ArsR family regulator|nr:hypothetical protein [Zoogloeaceae bacterium]